MGAWQVRDTGALRSPSHGTGENQPRGEHGCWGGALLGETLSKLAVSSALLAIWPPRNTNNREVLFLNLLFFFCAHHDEGAKPSSEATVSTYLKHSRTAFNRLCTEQRSTYSSTKYVRVDHNSATTQTRRHETASQVLPRAMYEFTVFEQFIRLFLRRRLYIRKKPTNILDIFTSTADTQPCDRPPSRLYDFQHGYRCDWRDQKQPSLCCHFNDMFHVAACCVFKTVFPPIDIQQALLIVQHSSSAEPLS